VPALVRPLDVELHECARQLLILPGGGRLARAQANDSVVYPDRLARFESQVANDAVALVEETQDRDALRHGGDARLLVRTVSPCHSRTIGLLRLIAAPAPREKQEQGCAGNGEWFHAQSGFQGW
jgi:hypothetical protein